MNQFLMEILSQPQALKDTVDFIQEDSESYIKIIDCFRVNDISRIIFTGMGSSFFCSYIAYYYLNQHKIIAEMREAGEFLLYSSLGPQRKPFKFEKTAVVAISQSGESGEIVELLDKLKRQYPITIGVTNSPDSTLALKSDITLLTKAGIEESVTSKSYVSTIIVLYYLSIVINFKKLDDVHLLLINNTISSVKDFLNNMEKNDILNTLFQI